MPRLHTWWIALLLACVLALPTSAALAAHQTPAAPHQPQYILCSSIIETDNIQVNNGSHNPFWDDLQNEWIVYYDIQRDSHTDAPCSMRVVMRIFNPASDGSWKGTADVLAYENGTYDSYSYGKVSGSGTYQAHFVWRGPWFGADAASYQIEVNEFNGSSVYWRAYTDFSL